MMRCCAFCLFIIIFELNSSKIELFTYTLTYRILSVVEPKKRSTDLRIQCFITKENESLITKSSMTDKIRVGRCRMLWAFYLLFLPYLRAVFDPL